jgi:hypothetical protein
MDIVNPSDSVRDYLDWIRIQRTIRGLTNIFLLAAKE